MKQVLAPDLVSQRMTYDMSLPYFPFFISDAIGRESGQR
ncbi:hypothetical protein BN1221_02197c [Brenneria goodwinii]|uniref:Uncharacterized protein n=1 Tax=Brenneria goodwinii TaxID=1109412 RepID=A0A0G4JV29_9GAMM|nr:hypothetical protein BN1221_02197c [Brenneria goodwinii]